MSLLLSASQLKTYGPLREGPRGENDGCPRKWWFEKIARLPRPGGVSYGIVFGNVLHPCLERWLEADATGRDKNGDPVDLYPEGWDTDWENGMTITEADRELIPRLVQEAIERGILQRIPGQKVEDSFVRPLIPEKEVYVTGRIDLVRECPPTIQDHKGTVSMRYALSKAKLKTDDQMLLYAKVLGDRLNLGDTDEIDLAHNVFKRHDERRPDEDLTLRQTPAKVTFLEAKVRWGEFKERAREMLKTSACREWSEVEVSVGDQCNAYGGCKFLGICTGRESALKYKRRVLRLAESQPLEKEKPMGAASLEEALGKKPKKPKKLKGDALIDKVEEMRKPPVPKAPVNAPAEGVKMGGTKAQEHFSAASLETNAEEIAPVKATVVKKKRKTKKKQVPLTLMRGVMPTKGVDPAFVISFETLMLKAVTEVGETPWEIFMAKNGFDRQDAMKRLGQKVAEAFAGYYVLVSETILTPEGKALLSSLEPHASRSFMRVG